LSRPVASSVATAPGTAVDALRGVSLEVAEGELTAVMGPSGSGKSTLMHLLAGLDEPTSGTVELAGREITGMSDTELTKLRRQHIGFVFQFFNLLPMLSAEENVLLPLSIAGTKPDKEWVEELLADVGLTDRRTHRPSELSGGQQQRVAIARSLVTKPSVLFADEPTGNLDSTTSGEILELLRAAVEARGQTTVMVTHDARAATIADRILFLADGVIVRELGRSSQQDVLAALSEVSSVSWRPADGAGPEVTVPSSTGPESTVPAAGRGGGGAGLRPAGAAAGQGSEVGR
jgi:putative ABC transport system ATP-binding protein